MIKINLDLDPLVKLYPEEILPKMILKHAISAEIAGLDGVSISANEESGSCFIKTIEVLKENLDINLTVKFSISNSLLEQIIEIKPSLIVFPVKDTQSGDSENIITRVQVANILAGFEIPPEIEAVKSVAKLKSDYVVINCNDYSSLENIGTEIDSINNISKISALCAKLSIGVGLSGDLSMEKLGKLTSSVNGIHEIFLGLPIITSSTLSGYRDSVDSIKSIIY